MSELGTRKGERTKKVPRHMQFDDADYGTYLSARTLEQKDKAATAAEIAQVARLLQKYVAHINQRLRDHHHPEHTQPPNLTTPNPNPPDSKRHLTPSNLDIPSQKPPPNSTAPTKRLRDPEGRPTAEGKTGTTETKKAAQGSRTQTPSSSNLHSDQQYHNMLNEHIRSAYPNISTLSPEMLKTLDLPKQLLEGQNGAKSRLKEEKAKGGQLLRPSKGGREGREDLKPFKRQSYHVAIAYHIHLKRIKSSSPSPAEIDPTYPARKLRENQNQPPPRQ